jgi:hypothetical protein
MSRWFIRAVAITLAWWPVWVAAQPETMPARTFQELAGHWVLDEAATRGNIPGLPPAGALVIETTPTHLTVSRTRLRPVYEIDGTRRERPIDVFRLDGTETTLDSGQRGRFVLAAGAVVLITVRTTEQGYARSNIVTDAYSVVKDVLTVDRHLSVVVQPLNSSGRQPGHVVEFRQPAADRMTSTYRRAARP